MYPKFKRALYGQIYRKFIIDNDTYGIAFMFEKGSVLSDRRWNYRYLKQATAVEVDVNFNARCSFVMDGNSCRQLSIIDDKGNIHGTLDLEIDAPAAEVVVMPKSHKVMQRMVKRKIPQTLGNYDRFKKRRTSDVREM